MRFPRFLLALAILLATTNPSPARVTVLPEEDTEFWQNASQSALDQVWDNPGDDIYAELRVYGLEYASL